MAKVPFGFRQDAEPDADKERKPGLGKRTEINCTGGSAERRFTYYADVPANAGDTPYRYPRPADH